MIFLGCNISSVNSLNAISLNAIPLKCVSVNNQGCKIRPESFCDNNQRWNNDKYKCECKKLIYKEICDKEFIWNPSNCECECDKSCDVGEYSDYANCECRKRLIDKKFEKY